MLMRNVRGRSYEILFVMFVLIPLYLYFGLPYDWLIFLIPSWIVFRIWMIYRQAVSDGLF